MELESEEDLIKIPHHEADIEQYRGKPNKVSEKTPTVFERCDSSTECDEDLRPKPEEMEEKSFVSRLYSFMKDKGTPIERIPHLGFKQINLWRIFKAVEKLGGYDSVTARRLWKSVYDELGGSPGSTSAATCTRRHYERLVLPFERRLAGEEDKPLPPRKPRKPYKRNLDGRVSNIEGKKKRTQRPDKEMDSEPQGQRIEEAETGTQALSTPWNATSDRLHPDRSQAPRGRGDRCTSSYTCSRVLQAPPSGPWSELIQPAAGEVISPLEKKKRMAQASLSQPLSPQGGDKDKDRPSVIYSSQPVIPASSNQSCNSSEGSPLPLSSSSSRSDSPYSVSSEDCPPLTEDKPASNTQLALSVIPKGFNDAHGRSDSDKSPCCSPMSIDLTGPHRDLSHTGYQSLNLDSNKSQTQDPAWKPVHKGSARSPAALVSTPSSLPFKNNWTPALTSGFTKVMPKIVQPLRPTPYPPGCKVHQSGAIQHEGSLTCAKKLHKMAHWLYQAEKREKTKTGMPKTLSTHPTLSHYNQPASYLLTGCDRPARDSWPQLPPHQAFIPGRMRLPQYQSTYRQIPMIPFNSSLIGSAFYSYPNSFPMWSPQAGYTLPGMSSTYPHKM